MYKRKQIETEIIKNGKVLKYIATEQSHKFLNGYLTDFYQDETGKLYSFPRTACSYQEPKYPRLSFEGIMYSFEVNFKNLLESLLLNCSDEELDKFILKCEHPISKIKAYFEKKQPDEDSERLMFSAINEKIKEIVKSNYIENVHLTSALERTITAPRTQNLCSFHNALQLELYLVNNPVEEKIDV